MKRNNSQEEGPLFKKANWRNVWDDKVDDIDPVLEEMKDESLRDQYDTICFLVNNIDVKEYPSRRYFWNNGKILSEELIFSLCHAMSNNLKNMDLYHHGTVIAWSVCNEKILRMGHTFLGDKGIVALCKMIEQSDNDIKGMELRHTGFGDVGSFAIARLLEKKPAITKINIAGNRIEWRGALVLADVLRKSRVVKMDINMNNIGEIGGEAMYDVIAHNNHLEDLVVENDFVPNEYLGKSCEEIRTLYTTALEHG